MRRNLDVYSRTIHLMSSVVLPVRSDERPLTPPNFPITTRPPSNLHNGVYVDRGPLGLSLFVAEPIKRGRRILRFSGPIINFEQAVQKGDRECYPLQVSQHSYIDLDAPGCFANHSCAPNAGIVNDLNLVALKNLIPGEEIRYDYSASMDEDSWTMECHCESAQCRGVVTDFRLLPAAVRDAYLCRGIVQSFIALQYRRRGKGGKGDSHQIWGR